MVSKRARLIGLIIAQALGVTWAQTPGYQELYRLDLLPAFKGTARIGSVSSYDRSGGNDDGFSGKYSFVRRDPEGVILADLKGPGVIYRLSTPTPSDDVIEFLFDGETKPRVEARYRDLFLGTHPLFPKPLVGFGVGGYFSYVPVPFAHSCVVRLRAAKTQFYQINYALFPPGTPIQSLQPTLSESDRLDRERALEVWSYSGSDLTRFTAPPEAAVVRTRRSVVLEPKSSQTVFRAERGGRIVGLRLAPASVFAGKARDLVLRITFDEGGPSVLCPVGDFFGYAWGQPAMQSLLVGTAGDTNYCYFPMPYQRGALVELISERESGVEVQAEILSAAVPRGENEGTFHAVWRRENPTTAGVPFRFLETEGRGHLVGVVLQAQGFESGKTLFFEGDDQTTIDGELVIHGTGSEDFFNGGWYDVPDRWEKALSFPMSGCLGYAKHLGRTGGYRLLLGDAYSYRRQLLQTIEHAGEKNSIPTDYCSVSYFYSDARPRPGLALPPVAERAVVDPKEIIFPAWWQLPIHAWSFGKASLTRKKAKVGPDEVQFLSFAAEGEDWFGPHFLSPTCDLPATGEYAIYIEVLQGPTQGKIQLFQDENPVAPAVDLFAEQPVKSGRLLLGKLRLSEGKNHLMLKLPGKNERSSGLGLDLISIVCVRGL